MNAPIKPEKIMENLTLLNEYRRGMRDRDHLRPSPGEIGITIECAIAYIRYAEDMKAKDKDDGK